MRALVAGGAGFVGSHTCRALLAAGHEVICLDDLSTGARANIEELESRPDFTFLEVDVAATPPVEVDVILHLASPASPVDYERMPLQTMAANSLGTWRLLEIAADTGARLTFASTSEVYGDPLVHPQAETYWGNVDPIGPRSCYDESKRFGEALLMAMRRQRGVQANIVRFFNTYGPRMRHGDGRAIPELVASAIEGRPMTVHGDGSQTRSFCYVSDLVDGFLDVALDPTNDGEVFNVGNPAEVSIRELAERIREIVGSDSPIAYTARRPGDPERRRPDIAKIQARYGWEPRIGLAEGLAETVATFRPGVLAVA
ncbi:MAG: NAD-dependent epimerase/dehydratase family protein [Candidatus Limnocylindrales bacterium]